MQPQRPRAGRRRASSRRGNAPPPREPDHGPADYGPPDYGPAGHGPGGHGPGGPGGRGGGPRDSGGYAPGGYLPGGGPGEDPFGVDATHGISGDLDRAFEGARRERVRQVVFGVVSVTTVVAVGAGGVVAWATLTGATPKDQPITDDPTASASASADSAPAEPPVVTPRQSVFIPAKGTGAFSKPIPGKRTYGTGKLLRYVVEVEGGIRQDPRAFTLAVDRILADPRGWTAGGKWSFKRVATGQYDFVVKLASPGTTDKICGAHGLDTGGKVNCSAGKQVVVNLKRWLLLTTYYRGQPDLYHALVINHEVGHRLGVKHMTCPGKGRPAPVMQQQIFGLKGCRINGWPYDTRGRFLAGPVVP